MEKIEEQKPTLADQDLSDEFKVNLAISEFNEVANAINNDNSQEVIAKLKARRNIIVNMMQVYLAKFNNKPVLDDFFTALEKAKDDATKDGKVHKYLQYLNEIKTVGFFLGIRENIADKLAEQTLDAMMEEEQTNQEEV